MCGFANAVDPTTHEGRASFRSGPSAVFWAASVTLWAEFATIAIAHALAIVSPGPDLALVLRQSINRGRRAALWTSVGIGCGVALHFSYCVLGLGLLLQAAPVVMRLVKFAGAAYFGWVGLRLLRSRPRPDAMDAAPEASAQGACDALRGGLAVNLLNPKAVLFFMALFALRVSPSTPRLVQAGYGVWCAVVTVGWFSLVSILFTKPSLRERFLRNGHWVDRLLGLVFVVFAFALLVGTARH